MGGFIGAVEYEGNLEEFLPLLILGQYTHVGKYAVWGNGRYEVVSYNDGHRGRKDMYENS
jgi:hypothetical protein